MSINYACASVPRAQRPLDENVFEVLTSRWNRRQIRRQIGWDIGDRSQFTDSL